MGVERQQGRADQLFLFEGEEGAVRPGAGSEGGTGTAACEEQQRPTASERKRALPEALMLDGGGGGAKEPEPSLPAGESQQGCARG